jgi:serine/threonine-protein kinase
MRQLPSVEAVLGKVIDGKYRLDSLIGLGGMGRVFCSTHLQLNKTFALKLMSFPAQDSPQLSRFKREAEALGKIRHPNVVGVTDFGITSDNVPYIVMEYIQGMSLRTVMERQGSLSEKQALTIAKQICAGLYAAHLQGIVHRDLKPENIMIEELADGDLIVRVLDFSIAKLLQVGDEDDNISDHGELLGTVKYMTPEQFLGNTVDARSDIFGICLVTYEMLAGVVPPATVSLAQPLKEIRPDISPKLSDILQKGLSTLPEKRQHSALELKREFESAEFASNTDASTQFTNDLVNKQGLTTHDETSSLELVVGQKLSYYQVIKKLGEGGMGEVYLAEDSRLGRKVALKLLPTEIIKDPNRIKRFEQEARTASALNHPNILTIYEIGDADGLHFIATEFIDGVTLKQKIANGLSLKEALKIAIQIANALVVAHPAGVVHRDIKPGNIMLRDDGYVKILDFGLAKFTEPGSVKKENNVGFNTEAGKVMGTPKYMSPEQARGQVVDARTDIFSFGVVLYQMITGQLPFDGATNSDIIVSVLEYDPPPISNYLPDVSPELERIIIKALRKDREERYQTIKDMLLDLKSLKQRLDFEKELTRANLADRSFSQNNSSDPSVEKELSKLEESSYKTDKIDRADRTDQNNKFDQTNQTNQADQTEKSLKPVDFPNENASKNASKNNKFLVVALSIFLLVSIGSVVGFYIYKNNFKLTKKTRSLAIVPFRNLKNDPDTDFLSFSLADSVINKLGYIDSLTLRPSSAINKYRNQDIVPKKVATELNVNTLLIGNFVKEGDDLRINAQLIDIDNDEIIWSDTLDLKYEKLLTVQTKVADQIVRELEIKLTDDEAEKLKRNLPSNATAYELCLRGIDLMNLSANNYQRASEVLEKSIDLDPKYALTWAYLGFCYASRATAEFGGEQEYNKAKQAYKKALELDPEQIEARLFSAKLSTDTGEVEEAVEQLRQILGRKPRHAAANWQLSYAYRYGGMLKESIESGERALDLDKNVANDAFNSYFYDQQYKKFIDSLPLPEVKKDSYFIFYRGFGHYYSRDLKKAKEFFDQAYQLTPDQIFAQIGKALSLGIDGKNREGIAILKESEEKIRQTGVSDGEAIYKIAQAYAVLGEKTSALSTLRLSIEKGFFCYPYFANDILLENVRSEAEFKGILEIAHKRHQEFKKKFF